MISSLLGYACVYKVVVHVVTCPSGKHKRSKAHAAPGYAPGGRSVDYGSCLLATNYAEDGACAPDFPIYLLRKQSARAEVSKSPRLRGDRLSFTKGNEAIESYLICEWNLYAAIRQLSSQVPGLTATILLKNAI
jgi:hypothetical protein